MHGFICMDSKTMSHRQQLQHIESHIEESFHSTLLYVLVLSLCIFIRSPYMSSFISFLDTTELQNLLAEECWGKLFFFSQVIPLALGEEGTCVGICPLRKVKGAAGVQNYPDLGFISFSPGLWKHKKSGELICCGGGCFATDTRYTVVLRMFFIMRTYALQGRGNRRSRASSRGKHQLPS